MRALGVEKGAALAPLTAHPERRPAGARAALLIVLPQALRLALPPAAGQYQTLAKASSLAAAIGYPDIMQIVGGTVLSQTSQALEAMALGCPVVTTRCTSLPEVCGDAAYYVDPDNPQSIAQSLIDFETKPELRTLYQAKGKDQAAKFTWERAALETERHLLRVVAG